MHRTLGWVLGAGVMLVAAGCNIVGPAYLLIHGPEKTPAQFQPDKKRPTIVFVDDRANVLPRRALRQQIAASAQNTLLKEGVLVDVIDAGAAMNVAAHETAGQPMDIVSLTKAARAEVMIYIQVDSFYLSPDGQTFSPQAKFHVKVIDVTRPEPRVWPPEREGKAVSVEMKPANIAAPKTLSEQMSALSALADRSGTRIAQLFFSHETRDELAN